MTVSIEDYRATDQPSTACRVVELRRFEVRAFVAAGLKLLGPIEAIGALDDEAEPEKVTT